MPEYVRFSAGSLPGHCHTCLQVRFLYAEHILLQCRGNTMALRHFFQVSLLGAEDSAQLLGQFGHDLAGRLLDLLGSKGLLV